MDEANVYLNYSKERLHTEIPHSTRFVGNHATRTDEAIIYRIKGLVGTDNAFSNSEMSDMTIEEQNREYCSSYLELLNTYRSGIGDIKTCETWQMLFGRHRLFTCIPPYIC